MSDAKLILTPDEAAGLLPEGRYVHNYANPSGGMLIGCDYDRAKAIEAFKAATQIQIGGDACKSMKHPLAVFDANGRLTFFEADMAKVEAFEAERAA